MSGRPKKEEEGSSVSIAGACMAVGGAAAVGYLAYKMFFKESPQEQRSGRLISGSAASTSWTTTDTGGPRARMDLRNRSQGSNRAEVPEGISCIICLVNEREVLFEPCNHVCTCEDCAENTGPLCPICRCRITAKKPVYL